MEEIELLKKLVAIPSVNPLYGGPGEQGIERFVVRYIESLGLRPTIQEIAQQRRNVFVELGDRALPATVIEAHMDTVGVDGWKTGSPYELTKIGNAYYGRGSCDTKASLAAFLLVLTHFAKTPETLAKRLVFAATVDEEAMQAGAYELAKVFGDLGVVAAISGEPTRSDIVVSHKGAVRYRLSTEGSAAHGSTPHLGRNAVVKACSIVGEINKLACRLNAPENERRMEGGSLNIGKIDGGIGFNIVPDKCSVELDRRIGLGETVREADEQIRSIIAGNKDAKLETILARPPLTTGFDSRFSIDLLAASECAGYECSMKQVSYMTNAVAYEEARVAGLVFGPGDIAQAHKIDEYIEEGEMEKSIAILIAYFSR